MHKVSHVYRRKRSDYGLSSELAAALSDGPRTLAEIEDHFNAYHHMFGMYAWQLRQAPETQQKFQEVLIEALSELQQRGWVSFDGQCYSLTELGQAEAGKVLRDMQSARRLLENLQTSSTASKVSLVAYLILALVKFPAGLLSGSVGLINDSFDTLLDGLCSLLVYLGFRFQKERLVNIFQVLMLLAAGGLTLVQAVSGLFKPYEPDADLFTFLAALLSALICAGLYFYQRMVGLKNSSFGLITQSVDSRNHIIVAAGVTVGLIASLLNFALLDTLVGLAIAVLILKSAIEMGVELFHSLQGKGDLDLSRYRLDFPKMEQFRRDQLADWMLYLVQQKKATDRQQLISLVEPALAVRRHAVLQALGMGEKRTENNLTDLALQRVMEQGWLMLEPPIELTPAGKKRLAKQMGRTRWGERHRRMMYI